MKKILVTGGAGFIGSHLVDRLVADEKEVVVLDSFEEQVHQGKKPSYLNKNVTYIEGDVRDEKALEKALHGIETVFHLAAKGHVTANTKEAYKEFFDINVNGTENVIKEQFSDDPNSFSTQVDDVDLLGLGNYFPEYKGRDMDISYMDCVVNWRLDLDIRREEFWQAGFDYLNGLLDEFKNSVDKMV